MRNLTVKRNKSFVGCAMKIKIYIEDAELGDTDINGVRCRKLGELKSGEEKVFDVSYASAKVFAIADSLSKNYCNDFYVIPEGTEDVFISGKNKYNPTGGNPFLFDNNDNPEALANRKKGKKKGALITVAAILVGFIIGFAISFGSECSPRDKKFSVDGMTITLNSNFEKVDVDKEHKYDASYGSEEVAVLVLKEEFSLVEGFEDYTLEEYAELLVEANGLSSDVKIKDGMTFFDYQKKSSKDQKIYRYRAYVYKSDDAFWMIQFAIETKNYDDYADSIDEWARSVSFK